MTSASRSLAVFLFALGCSSSTAPREQGRIVTFGDSNVDGGWDGNVLVEASYISESALRLAPDAPNGSHQLAGKIERLSGFHAVNHGASGTTTGDGRHSSGSPNARLVWDGVSRFDAEVLGAGEVWNPGDGKPRVNAFVPNTHDYVFVSMGTNDGSAGVGADSTIADLAWMAGEWIHAGLPASHFIVTTLAPRTSGYGGEIPNINPRIRQLAETDGLSLIDLSLYVSSDDGLSWRSASLTVDGVHYVESVREWLAERAVAIIKH